MSLGTYDLEIWRNKNLQDLEFWHSNEINNIYKQ